MIFFYMYTDIRLMLFLIWRQKLKTSKFIAKMKEQLLGYNAVNWPTIRDLCNSLSIFDGGQWWVFYEATKDLPLSV